MIFFFFKDYYMHKRKETFNEKNVRLMILNTEEKN